MGYGYLSGEDAPGGHPAAAVPSFLEKMQRNVVAAEQGQKRSFRLGSRKGVDLRDLEHRQGEFLSPGGGARPTRALDLDGASGTRELHWANQIHRVRHGASSSLSFVPLVFAPLLSAPPRMPRRQPERSLRAFPGRCAFQGRRSCSMCPGLSVHEAVGCFHRSRVSVQPVRACSFRVGLFLQQSQGGTFSVSSATRSFPPFAAATMPNPRAFLPPRPAR